MTLVAHGIVAAPPVALSAAGLRGRPLGWTDCGDLGVWTTDLGGPLRLDRQDAFAHHRVVEEICAAQTFLPVRFGTVFATADAARDSLRERAEELRGALTLVDGKRELAVTLLWRDAPTAAVPAELSSVGPGTRFMEERRAHYEAENWRRRRAAELAASLVAELAVERELVWHEICTSAHVAVSLAVLVPSDQAERRKKMLAQASARLADVTGVVNGPWPPYTFVGNR